MTPVTDDRPFFGHYFTWSQAADVRAALEELRTLFDPTRDPATLAVALPVFVALIGAAAWLVTGRALRPALARGEGGVPSTKGVL